MYVFSDKVGSLLINFVESLYNMGFINLDTSLTSTTKDDYDSFSADCLRVINISALCGDVDFDEYSRQMDEFNLSAIDDEDKVLDYSTIYNYKLEVVSYSKESNRQSRIFTNTQCKFITILGIITKFIGV